MEVFFYNSLFKRALTILVAILVVARVCLSQENKSISYARSDKESFMNLKNEVIKKEIAFFNMKGFNSEKDSLFKTKVNGIPLLNCTDTSATFEKGNMAASEIMVSIYSTTFDTGHHKISYDNSQAPLVILIDNKPFWGTDGGIPKEKVKSIRFLHYKYQLILPDSAVTGIYEPNFCDRSSGDQKRKQKPKLITTYCKVFRSEDRRRVYIYMLNGKDASRYEVTWVIQDSKYYTRVIDYIH